MSVGGMELLGRACTCTVTLGSPQGAILAAMPSTMCILVKYTRANRTSQLVIPLLGVFQSILEAPMLRFSVVQGPCGRSRNGEEA